jgi:single-stranded-DNA-specific exonuclease
VNLRVLRRPTPDFDTTAFMGLHPVLARAYAARGLQHRDELVLTLDRLLPVGGLTGIEAAAELLLAHRAAPGRVLIVGDFDADGATSTAVLVRGLRRCGFAAVDFLVPNRFDFGYGLTPEIVAVALVSRPTLIVTVDNGISSNVGVAAARTSGVQVLITDHHLPGVSLPVADVILNPNVPGNDFGSKYLAGVGVAFYLLAAVVRKLGLPGSYASDTLDLVALGTVADLVPLDRNNRVLVAQGIARIRAGACVPGIRALLQIAKRQVATLVASDLGFAVAPRLNAAGRIDDMSIGIRCLLADSPGEAMLLAEQLDVLNRERRDIEADMQRQAMAAVRRLDAPGHAADTQRAGVVLFDPDWHQGVVGLVAGRVKDRVRRPVVAFAHASPEELRGSARSVPGVHIRDVLQALSTAQPDLIVRFGGHAMAAGLTLVPARLDEFARAFDREVTRWLGPNGRHDSIETDGALTLEEIALSTATALRAGGPWGQAFPEPSFDGVFQIHQCRVVGARHLKLWVEPVGSGRRFDAIAFNSIEAGASPQWEGQSAQLIYRLDINDYRGETRLQLLIDHLQAVC